MRTPLLAEVIVVTALSLLVLTMVCLVERWRKSTNEEAAMFNEWWKLPMQIAMGLVLSSLIQAVAIFVLRALGAGKIIN